MSWKSDQKPALPSLNMMVTRLTALGGNKIKDSSQISLSYSFRKKHTLNRLWNGGHRYQMVFVFDIYVFHPKGSWKTLYFWFFLRPVTKLFMYVSLTISLYTLGLKANQLQNNYYCVWTKTPSQRSPPPQPMCLGLSLPQEESPCYPGRCHVSLPVSTAIVEDLRSNTNALQPHPRGLVTPLLYRRATVWTEPADLWSGQPGVPWEIGMGAAYGEQEGDEAC